MTRPAPTVFVVDDDDRVRRAVRRLLESVGLAVRTFASVAEFLEEYQPSSPGCIVLDVRMPGLSGLDLQAMLLERRISIPVIFVTGHGTIPMSVRAMKAGAVDFIEKPFDDQALLEAIRTALERDERQRASESERAEVLRRLALLTPREREVFERVIAGRLNKQIAADLGTSEQTIKIHRGRVMAKMGADSVAQLVTMAQAAGLALPTR
jgi:FixJ family two-component response regulator